MVLDSPNLQCYFYGLVLLLRDLKFLIPLAVAAVFLKKELINLFENASSLQERMQGLFGTSREEDASRDELWEKWKKIAANGDDEIFQKRLNLWQLDPSKARAHLGKVQCLYPESFPSWVETFREFMENLDEGEVSHFVLKHPLPFQELLNPFLHEAQRRLQRHLPEASPQIQDALLSMLAGEWSALFTSSLYAEFSIFRLQHMTSFEMLILRPEDHPTECYDLFIASFDKERWKAFFLEYCVLARLMVQQLTTWLAVSQEFLQRYQQDYAAIESVLFAGEKAALVDIQGNLSDPHSCGRTVFLLKFTGDRRVIYKPRDLHMEALFDRFATWCVEASNFHLLDLKHPIRILREGYGWEEYIEHKPCHNIQEAQEFFQRAGQLLALVYVLSGTDIHHENLMAHGKYPVLIDLEMLFDSHLHDQEVHNAHSELLERLKASVMQTGFLPSWQRMNGEHYSVGGLGICADVKCERWEHLNTDLMKIEICKKPMDTDNIPFLDCVPLQLKDHQRDLKEGFSKMYSFLQAKKEVLLQPDHIYQQFKQLNKRFVVRPTILYFHFLKKACRPEFLRSGVENSFVFESLFVLLNGYLAENLETFDLEIEQLERRDVPFFQRSVSHKTNSGFEKSSKIIQGLEQDDLIFQLSLIDISFQLSSTEIPNQIAHVVNESATQKPFESSLWLEEALNIKDVLLKSAHTGKDGSLCWYSITPEMLSENKFHLSVLDFDLYGGSLGVALFFSALGYATGDISLHQMALKTIKPALDHQETTHSARIPLGLDGLGAYFYTLATIGQLSNQPQLHQSAQKLVTQLSKKTLLQDTRYDIISGSASCALGLLAIHDLTGFTESLEKAVMCGDHLLNQRELASTGHRTWRCLDTFLTGFSHGAAGIAYALLRLFAKTGEQRFWEAALEAIEYERSVFIGSQGNWPDLRQNIHEKTMTSWCHGAPGIGLGRVGSLSVFQDEKVYEEIEIAAQTTMQYGYNGDDRLCCGNCGRVEYLLTAGLRLHRPEWTQKAMEYADLMAQTRRESSGKLQQHPFISPCLFLGLSGIGYTFLRCAVGDKVPNVLLLETVTI